MSARGEQDLAHEMRTPLTAIVAAASSLQATPDMDSATRARLLRVIMDCSRRLNAMIDELAPDRGSER